MAPKQPPTKDDQDTAVALIVMACSAQLLTEGVDDVMALAHSLWPKTIHRDALVYGPGACAALCAAFGIESEPLATLAQHLVAR